MSKATAAVGVAHRHFDHQNSNGEPTVFDHGKLTGSVPIGDSNNDRPSEIEVETRNSITAAVKIPTTNLGLRPCG